MANPYKLGVYRPKYTPKKKKSNAPTVAMANVSPPEGRARPQFGGFGAIWAALLPIFAMATSS